MGATSSTDVLTIQSSLCTHARTRTAFGFLFSDKCGFSTERLLLNKRRDAVENVAGMAFLLAADRVQTGSYIGLDYIIGDTGISQGRYVGKKWVHVLFNHASCARSSRTWMPINLMKASAGY